MAKANINTWLSNQKIVATAGSVLLLLLVVFCWWQAAGLVASVVTIVAVVAVACLTRLMTAKPDLSVQRSMSALQLCDTAVIVADENMVIRYLNDSAMHLMQSVESQLKTELPNFSAANLVGTNVDVFHKVPSHQRQMVGSMTSGATSQIQVAGLTFELRLNPIFDHVGRRTGTVLEWEDLTTMLARQNKEEALAMDNARIKQALDNVTTNVMMADQNRNIIYMNDSVQAMLLNAQSDIKEVLPNFDANNLMGSSIDLFHKNPEHQKSMLAKLSSTHRAQIQVGKRKFGLTANPVFNDNKERIASVVEWEDLTDKLAQQAKADVLAKDNARIKQALDNVSTNVMMADNDRQIIYMNKSVHKMLKNAEADIKAVLPGFDADQLLGSTIDKFHKNPAHQESMLASFTSTHNASIKVGRRHFALTANPVFDENQERLGSVVEWLDETEQVGIEKEIASLIDGATNGDLKKRISEDGKSGFYGRLAEGLNRLVGIADDIIDKTVVVFDALSHGDLTNTIEGDYAGAFKKLQSDANDTITQLTDTVEKIKQSASSVSSGADEIAQGNSDLSQRTEEQAANLEETASSMEEMTSAVRQSSENAGHVTSVAQQARERAQSGGDIVNNAVSAMAEINDSSKKIADIIGVIDEIAFQTNLLALNAAVEAARAGEQGRGFAVVAGEVRSLAQRSAGAAREIKDLIRDSVDKVSSGTKLVNQSGETLNEIVASVQEVERMVSEINRATTEQASGIEQVNQAVSQMDEVTQQNAALVEEASAAAEAMADQSRNLLNLVAFFTVSTEAPARPPMATPSARAIASPAPVNKSGASDDWEEF